MSACRASGAGRRRWLAAVGLAALTCGVSAGGAEALAQASLPPQRLAPPPVGAPVPTLPPGGPAMPAERAPLPPGAAIEVGTPRPFDADSIGLIDIDQGGLPADLWDGTSRATMRRLIAGLPAGTRSAAMRALARRLLSSVAEAPAPLPPAGGAAKPEAPSVIGLRAERALGFGMVADAVALAERVPRRTEDEALSAVLLQGHLLAANRDAACAFARRQAARLAGAAWQRALIACQALAGEHDRAALGLAMLREQQPEEDSALVLLVAALAGDPTARLESLPKPTALHVALLASGSQPWPKDMAATDSPAILQAIALAKGAGTELRLAAATRAEAFGALPAEGLAAIYDELPVTAAQLVDAFPIAEADHAPFGRALLYRAAKAETEPFERLGALQRSWRLARERHGYATAARTGALLAVDLRPMPQLVSFAGETARALLLAGRAEAARAWHALLLRQAKIDPTAAAQEALLWPIMRLAGGDGFAPDEPGRLERWLDAQPRGDRGATASRAILLSQLLAALKEYETAALAPALTGASVPREAIRMASRQAWLELKRAAEQQHLGEAIALAITVIGIDGAEGAHPDTIGTVVESLRAVGLEPEARALAVEAAILAGL